MEYNLEKSIKRYLKRKIKITLGFIVAFLLSCSFAMAATANIIISQDENEKIVVQGEYSENSFKDGIYINNSIISGADYGIYSRFIISNNNPIHLSIINNGAIDIQSETEVAGIYNSINWDNNNEGTEYTTKMNDIINNGKISVQGEKGYGIYNFSNSNSVWMTFSSVINRGIVVGKGKEEGAGIINYGAFYQVPYVSIPEILNYGIIFGKGENGTGAGINNRSGVNINNVFNSGIIRGEGLEATFGISLSGVGKITSQLKNDGFIIGNGKGIDESEGTDGNPILSVAINNGNAIGEILNNGVVLGTTQVSRKNEKDFPQGVGIYNPAQSSVINKIDNNGIILGHGNSTSTVEENKKHGYGIFNGAKDIFGDESLINDLSNKGIIYGEKNAVFNIEDKDGNSRIEKFENYGLLINQTESENVVSGTDVINYGLMFTVKDDGTYEIKGQSLNNDNVVNAELKSDSKGTESISAGNYSGKYINGITDTLKVDKDAEISNSVINGYTNAVVFEEGGHSLTLTGTTVNGGVSNISDTENSLGTAILGSISGDKLTFVSSSEENKTVINGNIDLGAGDDMLTINNTVQINGNIDGGTGGETEIGDTLIFGSSSAKSSETENMNILYNISGFENINVDNKITLFENIKVTDLKNITIEESGEVVLRIDGTNNNSHALLGNTGTVSSSGGKLLLALNGVGEGATIEFGDMILGESIKGNEIGYAEDITLDTTSLLHSLAKGENNTVTVKTVENLPETDIPENVNYDKLNKIYQSIRSVDKVGEFNIDDDKKLTAFTKYLNDIYAGNPYAYSSELSRKTMGMMRNLVDKDLKPELNKWAVYGGFTHVDGGTENSYYGKGYYTYDIGSRDIKADTKITGGYFKAEFGKSQDITTGIIFGGNNSETEIGASNVEGDSFYFGAYAKKYLNNFRFTLGAGFQHGDYKGDRTAVGYEGITETQKYDSNYHDRGFDIYGNIKYSKELGNNFFFEPSFTLSYTYLDQDGAKDEEGTLATETDSQYFDYSSGEINLDLRKSFAGEKLTHSLTAGVSYERMLSGYDEEYITGRIKGGTDFDILVPEKEKDIFSLNAKYELETEKGILFDVKGSYRFEHDTDQNEWTVGTGIGYKF